MSGTTMPTCPHCSRAIRVQTTFLPPIGEPEWRKDEAERVRQENPDFQRATAPAALPSRQDPPAVARFFGGPCKKCGSEVWLKWRPEREGGLLCATCYQEARRL